MSGSSAAANAAAASFAALMARLDYLDPTEKIKADSTDAIGEEVAVQMHKVWKYILNALHLLHGQNIKVDKEKK